MSSEFTAAEPKRRNMGAQAAETERTPLDAAKAADQQREKERGPGAKEWCVFGYLLFQTLSVGAPLYGFMSAFPKGNKLFAEDVQLQMFKLLLLVSQVASFPASVINDWFGPKKVAMLCMVLNAAGFYFFARGVDEVEHGAAAMTGSLTAFCVLIGTAGPMQITSMQLALIKLFPKVCSNVTTTLINGSYDTSGFAFAGWVAIAQWLGGVSIKSDEAGSLTRAADDVRNTKAQDAFISAMYMYAALAAFHLVVVVFLYPNTTHCTRESDSDGAADAAEYSSGASTPGGGGDLEGDEDAELRLAQEQDPNSWPAQSWPFRRIIAEPDFLVYTLWFGCQFQTFSGYLATQGFLLSDDMLDTAGYLNYVLSIPAAFLIGSLFQRAAPKSQVMGAVSVLGVLFQLALVFLNDVGETAQCLVFPLLACYRAAIFSALWIYFPTIFGIGRLGAVYGLALTVSAVYCKLVERFVFDSGSLFGMERAAAQGAVRSFNVGWLLWLVANGALYFGYSVLSDRKWRAKGRHAKHF